VGGAWRKGTTVGNWREGGCAAQSLIHSYSFISTTVDKTQLRRKETMTGLKRKVNIKYMLFQSLRQHSTAVEDAGLSAPESGDEVDSYSTTDW